MLPASRKLGHRAGRGVPALGAVDRRADRPAHPFSNGDRWTSARPSETGDIGPLGRVENLGRTMGSGVGSDDGRRDAG